MFDVQIPAHPYTYSAPYTPRQFSIFRIVFGLYLTCHFWHLSPDATELFSNQGMIPTASSSPLFGYFPNVLAYYDSPEQVQWFMMTSVFLSILFTCGIARQPVSLFLWYMWTCLFHRNIFILNPSLANVGWLLLSCVIIPRGESLRCHAKSTWYMPTTVYWGAWFLMALGYTLSGIHKLQCPSWLDGTALYHILLTPLARQNIFTWFFFQLPWMFIKVMTWISLLLEISFLPFGIFARTRWYFWMAFLFFHFGILLTINFSDLTLGVFMIHFFVFDCRWLRSSFVSKNN